MTECSAITKQIESECIRKDYGKSVNYKEFYKCEMLHISVPVFS